jgi:hypothetical protein
MAAWVSRPLLLAAMLVLLGHVCAGSTGTPVHAAAPRPADTADGDHESLHAASCDAVTQAATAPAVTDAGSLSGRAAPLRVSPVVHEPAPEPVPRPPRFLQDAALRI